MDLAVTSLWNDKPALYEASDVMFLVPVYCVSGVHNLDASFWYEILVPVLGPRTWVVCHRPYDFTSNLLKLLMLLFICQLIEK